MKIKKKSYILDKYLDIIKRQNAPMGSLVFFETEEENSEFLHLFMDGIIEDFLISKNALISFIKNISKRQNRYGFSHTTLESYILGAFSWANSNEGAQFWIKIEKEYKDYISKIKKDF